MNTEVLEPTTQAATTDIAVIVAQNPGVVLLDREKYSVWYESLKAKGMALAADASSKKNRDALRSFAADVRSEKAGIKKARLRLTEEWRSMTAQANAAGKEIDEQLESLAVKIRKPLTEWEEAEDARIEECRAVIAGFKQSKVIAEGDTAATVRERGSEVYVTALDAERFGDLLDEAQQAKDDAVATLQRALARLTQEEADKAELDRLRAEAAERAEADRIAAEQAEAARLEAERVENERIAAERAEQHRIEAAKIEEERQRLVAEQEAARIEQARKDAAEAAQHEAEQRAREEQAERDRQHEVALQAEREKVAAAERARQAEIDRAAAAEAARVAEQERLAKEQAKREASQRHRTAVKTAAKKAIMAVGADEDLATKIVLAIIAGEVPAVTLAF